MALYVGIDLHARNNQIGIIDQQGVKIGKSKLVNDFGIIMDYLKTYEKDIAGIVVESTFNWYWLIDALMEQGYKAHLANPSAIKNIRD